MCSAHAHTQTPTQHEKGDYRVEEGATMKEDKGRLQKGMTWGKCSDTQHGNVKKLSILGPSESFLFLPFAFPLPLSNPTLSFFV